jgi:hypothetical protein
MNDIVGYIFQELASSKIAIKNVNKVLKSQNRVNRSFVIFAICTTACAAVMKKRLDKQSETIKQLNDKITALQAGKETYEL